jgi:hypothetical protein
MSGTSKLSGRRGAAGAGLAGLILLAALLSLSLQGAPARAEPPSAPVHQLRIYEVPRENRLVFHERFRDHAARIMAKYDFHIVAMWESEFDDRVEFVYLLEWPDEATMKDRWGRFMADREWADIKRRTGQAHGTFVNAIEDRTLRLTDYSPDARLSD